MTRIEDLAPDTYSDELHVGFDVRSVGWLGRDVPRTGRVPAVLVEALQHYRSAAFHDDGDLGSHVCEICGSKAGRGEFWIEWADIRYVLPTLVTHYIDAHDYLPPDEFLAALSARWERDRDGSAV